MERVTRAGVYGMTCAPLVAMALVLLTLTGCPNPVAPPGGGGETPTFADVTGLVATPGNGQVVLEWTDPTDSGFLSIEVTWVPGGSTPVEVAAGVETYTAGSMTNGVETTFSVVAVYGEGASEGVDVSATPTSPPVADIERDPAGMALVDETIEFTGAGSTDADGTIASCSWDFDDGSATATGTMVVHSYSAAGTYTVSMTATDNLGATDTTTESVYVNAPPVAVITTDTTDIEAGESVDFGSAGSTDSNGTIVSYAWDFGDGDTDTVADPLPHVYASAGVYTAELTVTDNDGTTDIDTVVIDVSEVVVSNQSPVADISASDTWVAIGESIDFDATGSTDSDGTIVSYAWTFGDTGTATGSTTSHSYAASGTYTVGLLVTDDEGATDTESVEITVNEPPTAVAVADDLDPDMLVSVSFTGSGSSDSDGTISSYYWDFGDGEDDTSADTTHFFPAVGSYTVTLTVTDDFGATDTDTVEIDVHSPPPTADAGEDQDVDILDSYMVNLSGSGTDPDGTVDAYLWEFVSLPTHSGLSNGDITGAATTTASFDLSSEPFDTYPGDEWFYVLQLTVTDNNGETDSDQVIITAVGSAAVLIE